MRSYKSQHKIGNPFGYMRSLVTADMKVKLHDLDITSDIQQSAGSGTTGGSQKPGTGSEIEV